MVTEAETSALRSYLQAHSRRFISRIGEVEVRRAVLRAAIPTPPAMLPDGIRTDLNRVFAGVALIEVTGDLTHMAADLSPPTLGSLDALHLASALAVADEIDAFVSYDSRLAEAAAAAGLVVVAPGSPGWG